MSPRENNGIWNVDGNDTLAADAIRAGNPFPPC